MGDEDDSKTIFELNNPEDRDARYEKAIKILPELASRNYPTEKVIRILNRLGTVDDEGFKDKPEKKVNMFRVGRLGMEERRVVSRWV